MSFNREQETERVVEFIRDYYKKNNLKGAILGISGGKDSGRGDYKQMIFFYPAF